MFNRFWKVCMFAFAVLFLCFAFPFPSHAQTIPDPVLADQSQKEPLVTITGKASNGNNETPGEWYIGSTPPNLDPNAPILLFVPGLNNVAQVFWEDNDMYQTAYDAGYQTTFVQLYDAGGESADMWDNGQLLAEKIQEIANYFNGKPITIVAYSKGGVDTQTALAYYGAWQYVDNVITLSSPHHGSQLADLAYSSSAGWLADLLGSTGPGTYSMQMGYMADYRAQTDSKPFAYYNDYYTLGGTAWGSAFTSTFYGGMYLSQYGQNDGVVTAVSSQLPRGQVVAIGDWTHTTVRTGVTFPVFENYLANPTYIASTPSERRIDTAVRKNQDQYNEWVDGGPLLAGKETNVTISVEDDVNELTLNLLTSSILTDIKLVSPTGKTVTPKKEATKITEGVFQGAIQNTIQLKNPSSGDWKLYIKAEQKDAYLLTASFDAAQKVLQAKKGKPKTSSDATSQIFYQLDINPDAVQEGTLQATYKVTQSSNPTNTKTIHAKGKKDLSKVLPFNKRKEVYNITIEVEGKTQKGSPFKRTIIDSIYID